MGNQGSQEEDNVVGQGKLLAIGEVSKMGKNFSSLIDLNDATNQTKKMIKKVEKKLFVVHGAVLWCNKGSEVETLKIVDDDTSREVIGGKRQAHALHCEEENIECFGECEDKAGTTDTICKYIRGADETWEQTHAKLYLGNDKDKKALMDTSYLYCKLGGKITVETNGQHGDYDELKNLVKFVKCIGFYNVDLALDWSTTNKRSWDSEQYLEMYNALKNWGYLDSKEQMVHMFTQILAECDLYTALLENVTDEWARNEYDDEKWKGSGYFHLTWEGNYKDFQEWLKNEMGIYDKAITTEGAPYVAKNYAMLSAIWVWQERIWDNTTSYEIVESGADLMYITKSIHGMGSTDNRVDKYNKVLDAYEKVYG